MKLNRMISVEQMLFINLIFLCFI